ncbi:neuronal acetylcholine receptor subunit alpha-10 [Exaiptasia diaphana]|uniref:Neuronal acetylcholine receptor subunit alpha-10-like n=1 Tax=Exaiptasia diaphana TaxID=2652724 RepID=A0A913Y7L7_EXADI|nr:neuronal acetylcholine receptor subunit alpha-10 [Exaiptasia diaphana]KXJ28794.1 Neuronal acetylcholine receptor subunit alpha-3 [Exaiptasia diaphana]
MMLVQFSLCFCILTWYAAQGEQDVRYKDHEYRLIRYLFANYSSEVRPVLEHSEPVGVKFDLAYSQLVTLNAKSQILTSKIWVRQFWSNPFLRWNSTKFGGVTFINISPKLVWKPDIVMYNSIQGDGGEMYNFLTKVQLFSDGTIQWFAPTEVKSICKIDITYFPFDTQVCTMVFGSWTFTGSFLNLSLIRDTADLSGYTESGEWDLLEAKAKRNVVKYSCCPDPYIDITYTFVIRRKLLFYINNLIFPIVALAVLGIFGYFLPPESGERISLLITIMLGLSVYTLIFTENIPATSEVTPLLSRYSTAIMVELGISLVLSCLVVGIYHGDCAKDMPRWFEALIFNVCGKVFRMKYPPKNDSNQNETRPQEKSNGLINSDRTPIYFPLQKQDSPGQEGVNLISGDSVPGSSSLTRKLDEMITKLDKVLDSNNENQTEDERARKWHFAAHVVDKIVFWIYSMTVLFSTIALYLMIPYDITSLSKD